MSLFEEVRRRNVHRVALTYIAGSWLIVQVAETLLPAFDFEPEALRVILVVFAIGFVPALILSWKFEWTPSGLIRDDNVAPAERGRSTKTLDRAITVFLVIAVAYFAVDKFILSDPTLAGQKSIAVLPFQNMTGNAEWDYIGDGVAEEVINSLSHMQDLRVRPQIQSFRYRDADMGLDEIARELDANYVVTGSVRMSGQNLRLAAQLVDPARDENLRSITEEYATGELFDGQDAVSRAIAEALAEAAGLPAPTFEVRQDQPDPEAYDLYLRGRHIWHRRGQEPLQPAIDYFREAVQIDPEFGRGWAALAMAYLTYPSYSPRGYATWNDAEPAAKKALELDPEIAEAYSVLATFAQTRFEWERAESLFREGVRRDDQSATAHYWYAEFLEVVGKHAESIEHLQRALQLDPTYRPPQVMQGVSHMNFRDYATAAELLGDIWQGNHRNPLIWMANFMVAVYNQDTEGAEAWIERSPGDDVQRDLLRRFVNVKLRQQIDASLVADLADNYWRRPDYPFGLWLLGNVGGYEESFGLVDNRLDNGRLLEMRVFWAPGLGTRGHPGFMQLMERVGLLEYWESSGWGSICVPVDGGLDCSGDGMTPELLESLLVGEADTP